MVVIILIYAAIVSCLELVVPRWRLLVLALLSGALGTVFLIGVVDLLAAGSTFSLGYR
jgi:hypothetical protein